MTAKRPGLADVSPTAVAAEAQAALVALMAAAMRDAVRVVVREELQDGLHAHHAQAVGNETRLLLTVAEAAKQLRCCERQVRKLIAAGRLNATKLAHGGSSRVLISQEAIDQLVHSGRR
jgi:excisionase family DNA binding protein